MSVENKDKVRAIVAAAAAIVGCAGAASAQAETPIVPESTPKDLITVPVISLYTNRDATYRDSFGNPTDPYGGQKEGAVVGSQVLVFNIGEGEDGKKYYLMTPSSQPELWVSEDDLWGIDGTLKDVVGDSGLTKQSVRDTFDVE